MTNIVKLVQGSPEWHEHRRKYRNASETPVVLGVSPWATPYQLWEEKLGLRHPEVTQAMLHGSELEPAARAAYEARTGLVMQPLVLVDGEYSASLDGVTLGGERIVEIKCPFKGKNSALWEAADGGGHLPEHYHWQVQHQLMVAKAEIADVFVFDGSDGILLEVTPDAASWPRIHTAWDEFMQFVISKTPPPLSKGDVRQRNDAEWAEAAQAYVEAKRTADVVQRILDEAKGRLIALTSHSNESGAGVSVVRYWRKGSIDYSKIEELKIIDLERYRSAPREETRVIVAGS
jgi:putative phage-type endonuclease